MVKMLIVDDEKEICEFLGEFFTDKGYQVFTAPTGDEALRIVVEQRPSVLLLDIMMPGKNGLDTLKEAKAIMPQIKVIMVSALETADKIEAAMKLGADNYITKPLSLEYLEKDVRSKVAVG